MLGNTLSAYAQGVPVPFQQRCYSWADGGDDLLYIDRLAAVLPTSGIWVGSTNVGNIESIALNIGATILYATNDTDPDTLGSINLTTAVYTVIGSLTPASNPAFGAPQVMDDIDSLFVHPWTGDIWAITHGPHYIFRINSTTGAVVPDTFGAGFDFADVDLSTVAGGPADIDDLAIDPTTGRFYVIANGGGAVDRIVELNINGTDPPNSPGLNNPALGDISTTDIGFITVGGVNITDMEGWSFFNDGNFYGATGDSSAVATHANRMWQINPTNGVATEIGPIDDPSDAIINDDFESVACLTAPANTITGTVFLDNNANGTFDAGDVGQAGVTVRLCRDINNDGVCNAGESITATVVTPASGAYSFMVGSAGNWALDVIPATLPAGADQTGPNDNIEESDFINTGPAFSEFGNTDPNNNFGFTLGGPPPPPPPPPPPGGGGGAGGGNAAPANPMAQNAAPADPAPVIDAGVNPPVGKNGDRSQLTIMVTNPNTVPIVVGTVTDPIPPQFIVQGVSANGGGTPILNGQNFSWNIGTLQPGQSVTAFIDVIVGGDACMVGGPSVITHTATVNPSDSASFICEPSSLPTTGESPYSRLRIVVLIGVLTSLALISIETGRRLHARIG
jgi:hypothetical protein